MTANRSNTVIETIKTIIYAVVIAFTVRTFAYQPFTIPSGSMVPTLYVGDYLFVSKYSYGYSRYSLPFGVPILPKSRVLFNEPKRGDVAVFKFPHNPKIDFIKRIIGLPGDKIQIKNGVLHINDNAVHLEKDNDNNVQIKKDIFYINDRAVTVNGKDGERRFFPDKIDIDQFVEILPNEKKYNILEIDNQQEYDNTGVYYVPNDHYFAMGDNRDDSGDSRKGWFVPKENLVGRAEVIFFSIDKSNAKIWEIWKWPFAIRYGRFFKKIM